MTRAFLVSVALAAAECSPLRDPCFVPPTEVRDLRILGVAADPPEAHVDLATGVADPVTLRALIVQPGGEAPPTQVVWDLCPATDDPGCPEGSTVASNPGWGPDSSLGVQVSTDLIERSIAADPLHGLRDVRVRAVIHVQGATPDSASALLFFSPRSDPPNTAPIIAAVRTARQGSPLQDLTSLQFSLSEGKANAVRPVLAAGSLEEYDTVDLSGNVVRLQERVTWSFYSDASIALGRGLVLTQGATPVVVYKGLDDFEADEPDPGTPEDPNGLFLAIPVQGGGSQGKIWIVARDSRGATSWLSVPYFAIEERVGCQGPPPRFGCPELKFGCF